MQGIDEKVPGSAAKRAAGFPFSRSPGHSRAPVAAPGSVFTCVHTQPQGSFATWSYSGILGKVNSLPTNSSQRAASPGTHCFVPWRRRQAERRGWAAGAGRLLAAGRGTAPAGLGKPRDPAEAPRKLAAFPGLRDGSYVSGKCMPLWASPAAAYHG